MMIENITGSPFFGLVLTLLVYNLSLLLYKKTRQQLLNPFLVSLVFIIIFLTIFDIPLSHYMAGGNWILLILPFTIILLALPLYRQLPVLLEHKIAILVGITAGVLTSALSVFLFSKLLGIDKVLIQSILPKSITTPLGLIMSETLGGIAGVTILAITITGLMGLVLYIPIFKIFRITHPVAQGIAIGTTSHAIGTSKAMELGEIQGALSSLAIVLSGIITVFLSPVFLIVFTFL
jgi:putative effector of murein hydrolase